MLSDGPSPASPHPPRGWYGVYRKISYEPFSATLEVSRPTEGEAIELAKLLSGKMFGRFEVVNPKGYTVKTFGEIYPASVNPPKEPIR